MSASSTTLESSSRRNVVLGALIIVALTLIAYYPAMSAGFIWDDDQYVSENRLLQQGWEGLRDIWTPRKTPQYYPAVFTMFWLEHQIWGLNPHGYHIVNIVLHALNALLVWRLASMLNISWAWLIGAVFALHPVHVESVAWITERKNTLSALFYLLAAIAYLKFDDDQPGEDRSGSRWLFCAAALGSYILALLSKTVTCSLPAAIMLMMLWQRKQLSFARLAPLLPFFAVGLLLALNTAHIEREHVGATGEDFNFSIADRLIIASRALHFYAFKIVWPWPIIFTYPRWNIDPGKIVQYAWVASVVIAAIVGMALYLRGIRGPFLALAYFAGTLFPALGFVNVYPMIFSFVADHFQYLASLGVIALVVAGPAGLLRSQRFMPMAAALILTPLGLVTHMQCYAYENIETLFRDTLAKNNRAFMARNNLASELLRQAHAAHQRGDSDAVDKLRAEAFAHLVFAIEIKPDYPQALLNLSDIFAMYGRNAEALAYAQQALDVILARPNIQEMMQSGKRGDSPAIADAFRSVATLQAAQGHHDEAKANYREALTWQPRNVGLLIQYADVLAAAREFEAAAAVYQRVLQIEPHNATAIGALAEIAHNTGDDHRALALYREAIAAATNAESIRWNVRLARLLATSSDPNVRDGEGAAMIMQNLVQQTRRGDPFVLDALAQVLAEGSRFNDAIATGEEAANVAERLGLDEVAREIRGRVEQYRSRIESGR